MDWNSCLVNGVASLQCIPYLFANVVNFSLMAAGTVSFLLLLYAGLRYILASGDSKQLDTARKTITFAIAGLILVLCSYILLNILATITGVNCILVFGPFTQSVTINGHTYSSCFTSTP